MEGIEQNPVVYDLMSEMAFRHDKVDVKVMRSTSSHEYCTLSGIWVIALFLVNLMSYLTGS